MNYIKEAIAREQKSSMLRCQGVINLSKELEKAMKIPLEDWPYNFEYHLESGYRIVKQNRFFGDGWVELYEIENENGTNWADNNGTTGINEPPGWVIDAVLENIDELVNE